MFCFFPPPKKRGGQVRGEVKTHGFSGIWPQNLPGWQSTPAPCGPSSPQQQGHYNQFQDVQDDPGWSRMSSSTAQASAPSLEAPHTSGLAVLAWPGGMDGGPAGLLLSRWMPEIMRVYWDILNYVYIYICVCVIQLPIVYYIYIYTHEELYYVLWVSLYIYPNDLYFSEPEAFPSSQLQASHL